MSLTIEQKALRRLGLTSSELPGLVGLSSWLNPSLLYKMKVESHEVEENDFMRRGTAHEGVTLQRYAELYGVQLLDVGTVRHAQRPLILATPDAVIPGVRVVEAKVPSVESDKWGPPGADLCPPAYIVQCCVQCAVMNLPEAHLVRPAPGEDPNQPGFKLWVYTLPYDSELFEWLAAVAEDWWSRYVLPKQPPPGYRASKKKQEEQHP